MLPAGEKDTAIIIYGTEKVILKTKHTLGKMDKTLKPILTATGRLLHKLCIICRAVIRIPCAPLSFGTWQVTYLFWLLWEILENLAKSQGNISSAKTIYCYLDVWALQ